jgi:hypothetical protein
MPTLRFLLSPAHLGGARAARLTSLDARFAVAQSYRDGTLSIGEAFSWISALYFRAKLRYARHFGARHGGGPAQVIAPGFGLVAEDWLLSGERFTRLCQVPVDTQDRRFRQPLEAACAGLARSLDRDDRIVFLGGLAGDRYLAVLAPALGPRLFVPIDFVGRGQMQRGSLLLQAIAENRELAYSPAP